MVSQSGAFPIRLGTRIALVYGPIISAIAGDVDVVRVRLDVDKAGVNPARTSGAMSVEKVTADVITSSPGERSSSSTAR